MKFDKIFERVLKCIMFIVASPALVVVAAMTWPGFLIMWLASLCDDVDMFLVFFSAIGSIVIWLVVLLVAFGG